jgi:signal transduction histidine kinase
MSRHLQLVLVWILLQAVFTGWFTSNRLDLIQQRFEQDSRIGQRLLTEEASKLDSVLDTMVTYSAQSPQLHSFLPIAAELSARYPAILKVARYRPSIGWETADGTTPPSDLETARRRSLLLKRAVMTPLSGWPRSYWLVLERPGAPGFALNITPGALAPATSWPAGLQRVILRSGQTSLEPVNRAEPQNFIPLRFVIAQRLASRSQPLVMQAETVVSLPQLPWAPVLSLALASAFILWGLNAFLDQRETVTRTRRQTHFIQMARLNTLGEMAAGMAHEINQPLTAILANCQASLRLMSEEEADLELVRESIGIAAVQAKRAAAIISRLREDLDRPRQDIHNQRVVLAQIVDEVLFLLEPDCNARAIRIRFTRRDDKLQVRANRVALEQVVHNLLSNAMEAMRETPAERRLIELAVFARGDSAVLLVSDRGAGIPLEVLPRLFEPFFTTRKNGMGLGLAICETLIGELGGNIHAENRAAGGARFIVALPRAQNHEH